MIFIAGQEMAGQYKSNKRNLTTKPNIPRTYAATRFALLLFVLCMALFSTLSAAGQTTMPDTVCPGTTKPYWVTPSPGSTYRWELGGVVQPETTNEIFMTWNTLGNFILTVQETAPDNCQGEIKSLAVVVKNNPPAFIVPLLATGYCVENIASAVYNPSGTYYVDDLFPPRPDHFLVPPGSTLLDISGMADDCPGPLTISWVIDFAGASPPDLTGTGQISLSTPIQFPIGNNLITWTVTDAFGSFTVKSVVLTVFPRPEIGDISP